MDIRAPAGHSGGMDAIALGPLVFSTPRFAAVVALGVFLVATEVLARRVDRRFHGWATACVVGFVVVARTGHVIGHWPDFREAPLRALAFWQGGFRVADGVAAVLFLTLIWWRGQGARLWQAVVAVALAGAAAVAVLLGQTPMPPQALPDRDFATISGGTLNPAGLTGQPVVINLWATWCGPCRREMPALAQAQDDNPDLAILFVNQRESAARIDSFLRLERLDLRHVLLDPAGDFARHFTTIGLPVTIFVGRDGKAVQAHLGEISPEALRAGIARLRAD